MQTKIDRIQGADINALEAKIQEHIGTGTGDETFEDYGQGLVNFFKKGMKYIVYFKYKL